MRKLFKLETFETEKEAKEYIKKRKLRKYNLIFNKYTNNWNVLHNIYV